jgi:plasmid stabilization system protein ParE
MARLTWLPEARSDLRRIRRCITRDSPDHARTMVERIQLAVERLTDFPESGRVVPEFADTTLRELLIAALSCKPGVGVVSPVAWTPTPLPVRRT